MGELPERMTVADAISFGVLTASPGTVRNRMHRDRLRNRPIPAVVDISKLDNAKIYLTKELAEWDRRWGTYLLRGAENIQAVRRVNSEIVAFLDHLALFGVHLARLDAKTSQVQVCTRDERVHLITAWRNHQPTQPQFDFTQVQSGDPLDALMGKIKESDDEDADED